MAKVRALEGDIGTFANTMLKNLDERQRRLFLASFAEYLGYGGATKLSEVTGVTQQTISAGKKDLRDSLSDDNEAVVVRGRQRVRAEGGGRKSIFSRRKSVFTAGFPKYVIKRSLSDRVVRERDSEANAVSFSKEASQRQFL